MIAKVLVISLRAQLHHLLQFLLQASVIGTDLSNHLIPIQTKNKLRLTSNPIMPGDLRSHITVYLDNLKESILTSEGGDMLISDLTLRVPAGSEVDQSMRILVLEKMSVELF